MWNKTTKLDDLKYTQIGDYEVAVNQTKTGGLELYLRGFGVALSLTGYGAPLYLDLSKLGPVVYVWADINQEEPTNHISLLGAHESLWKGPDA